MFDSLLRTAPYNPPKDQRYTVDHPRLGPWERGAVLRADLDLVGADLAGLVQSGAIAETDAPHDPKRRAEEQLPEAPE